MNSCTITVTVAPSAIHHQRYYRAITALEHSHAGMATFKWMGGAKTGKVRRSKEQVNRVRPRPVAAWLSSLCSSFADARRVTTQSVEDQQRSFFASRLNRPAALGSGMKEVGEGAPSLTPGKVLLNAAAEARLGPRAQMPG